MGLFHKREEHTAYPPEGRGYGANHHSRGTSHSPKRGLFHKREEHTAYPPESSGYGANHHHSLGTSHSPKRGLFHRGGSSSPSSSDEEYGARRSSRGSHGGGLFHRHDRNREDPSIAAARKTLASAEESERAAGMAVNQARGAVAEAREHVKRLEGEAREEYVSCIGLGGWYG